MKKESSLILILFVFAIISFASFVSSCEGATTTNPNGTRCEGDGICVYSPNGKTYCSHDQSVRRTFLLGNTYYFSFYSYCPEYSLSGSYGGYPFRKIAKCVYTNHSSNKLTLSTEYSSYVYKENNKIKNKFVDGCVQDGRQCFSYGTEGYCDSGECFTPSIASTVFKEEDERGTAEKGNECYSISQGKSHLIKGITTLKNFANNPSDYTGLKCTRYNEKNSPARKESYGMGYVEFEFYDSCSDIPKYFYGRDPVRNKITCNLNLLKANKGFKADGFCGFKDLNSARNKSNLVCSAVVSQSNITLTDSKNRKYKAFVASCPKENTGNLCYKYVGSEIKEGRCVWNEEKGKGECFTCPSTKICPIFSGERWERESNYARFKDKIKMRVKVVFKWESGKTKNFDEIIELKKKGPYSYEGFKDPGDRPLSVTLEYVPSFYASSLPSTMPLTIVKIQAHGNINIFDKRKDKYYLYKGYCHLGKGNYTAKETDEKYEVNKGDGIAEFEILTEPCTTQCYREEQKTEESCNPDEYLRKGEKLRVAVKGAVLDNDGKVVRYFNTNTDKGKSWQSLDYEGHMIKSYGRGKFGKVAINIFEDEGRKKYLDGSVDLELNYKTENNKNKTIAKIIVHGTWARKRRYYKAEVDGHIKADGKWYAAYETDEKYNDLCNDNVVYFQVLKDPCKKSPKTFFVWYGGMTILDIGQSVYLLGFVEWLMKYQHSAYKIYEMRRLLPLHWATVKEWDVQLPEKIKAGDIVHFFGWSAGGKEALKNLYLLHNELISKYGKVPEGVRIGMFRFDPTDSSPEELTQDIPPEVPYYVNVFHKEKGFGCGSCNHHEKEICIDLEKKGINIGHWGVGNEIIKEIYYVYINGIKNNKTKQEVEDEINKVIESFKNNPNKKALELSLQENEEIKRISQKKFVKAIAREVESDLSQNDIRKGMINAKNALLMIQKFKRGEGLA